MCGLLPESSTATSSRTDSKLLSDRFDLNSCFGSFIVFNYNSSHKSWLSLCIFVSFSLIKSICKSLMGDFSRSFTHIQFVNADGLIWVSEWTALQQPVASSFLAVLYSDYMLTSRTTKLSCNGDTFTPSDLRKFAISQVLFSSSLRINIVSLG